MTHAQTSQPVADADTSPRDEWHELTSSLASDALDALGHREQCLGPDVGPLAMSQRVVGRAFTVRAIPATTTTPERPYENLLTALDHLGTGEVFVFFTDRYDGAGVWGELVTTASISRGAVGALTDGLVRDVTRILDTGFPVFSRGATPYDSKGRIDVIEEAVPVVIDGVRIAPGDLIVGDADGVCVIPAAIEADVLAHVREKTKGEAKFREAVASGTSVTDAFRTFRVL
jgi:regulator of RNase E activity RraA